MSQSPPSRRHWLVLLRSQMSLKLLVCISAVLSLCIFFSLHLRGGSVSSDNVQIPPSLLSNNHEHNDTCYVNLDLLRSYGFNSSVQYARWEIAVAQAENFTGFSDTIKLALPTYQTVPLDTEEHDKPLSPKQCTPSVTIAGPVSTAPANASHMLFGVATSLERLDESLDAFAHWAGGTNARVIALVGDDAMGVSAVQKRAREMGIQLTIIVSSEELQDMYFSMVKVLFDYRDELTQWAVLIDDDTFFPSMKSLVDRFSVYDATEPQYIGALTEDFGQMFSWSYMAYGGAGVFLSIPLLQELQQYYWNCYDFKYTGDFRLAHCIYAHTTTKLTWERGLHQLDLHGDASGFYESGRPLPLSLHHWKSWFNADMVALSQVAAICGEDCLLRRWQISSSSSHWFLINGFSVIQYPSSDVNTVAMEQTWEESEYVGGNGFAYSLGPLRPKQEDKVSFRLKNATRELGQVRQVYVDESGPQVLEVVWRVADDGV